MNNVRHFSRICWTILPALFIIIGVTGIGLFSGCSSYRPFGGRELTWELNAPRSQNPIFVAAYDHEFLWDVLVDVIDSQFEIAQEMKVQLYGDVLTEGRLDTEPKIGASVAELWHTDSVGFKERINCTFQTIRRRAMVRVIPEPNGYLIEIFVYKELEHKRLPINSPSSVANLRYEDSMDNYVNQIDVDPSAAGWIMIGRDTVLEERLLREITYRLEHPSGIIRKAKSPLRG